MASETQRSHPPTNAGENHSQQPYYFICVPCDDEPVFGRPAATIQGHDVCQDCFDNGIRPQCETYLKDENSPVTWGGRAVRMETVQHQFSIEFVQQYRARMAEYAIPPRQRLYCATTSCDKYLGEKTHYKASRVCSSCSQKTCTSCGVSLDGLTLAKHSCIKREIQAEDAFQDLQRGVDWQACPGCSMPINLREACNHITCRLIACSTHFCYLYGTEAMPLDGSDHWGLGKPCALYGPPRSIERRLYELDCQELVRIQKEVDVLVLLNDGPSLPWVEVCKEMLHDLYNGIVFYGKFSETETRRQELRSQFLDAGGQKSVLLRKIQTRLGTSIWSEIQQRYPSLELIVTATILALEERFEDLRAQLIDHLGEN